MSYLIIRYTEKEGMTRTVKNDVHPWLRVNASAAEVGFQWAVFHYDSGPVYVERRNDLDDTIFLNAVDHPDDPNSEGKIEITIKEALVALIHASDDNLLLEGSELYVKKSDVYRKLKNLGVL
jgi:hypothetical protein